MTRPVVVQKFGGTSVATAEGRSALRDRVAEARDAGNDVVVVVSAMGRAGDPYATDTLIGLLEGSPVDPREGDMLASCGELVTAVVVAHELRAAGIPAAAFSGADAGIVTDGAFGSARIVSLHPQRLRGALDEGLTPVVAGFQGCDGSGRVTTLGRGGSDTSACALGVALGAAAVEIHTDVDGVLTADPRDCAEARVLDHVAYQELFQMAHNGAKVMHAPAAELAMHAGIPLRIRNTFSGAPGTLVSDVAPPAGVATAVSHVDGIVQIRLRLPDSGEDGLPAMEAQARTYRDLADADVSLDMFTPCRDTLVFTVSAGSLPAAIRVLDSLAMPYEVTPELAKVTLVGAGMRGVPGVMATVAEALRDAGVPVLQAADSHTTISVLVPQESRCAAVDALHDTFGLDR